MKISFFDVGVVGTDLDLSPIEALGTLEKFHSTSDEELLERIQDTEIAIVNKIKITPSVIKTARKLRLICVTATGYDGIDTEACRQYGIGVTNIPGYSTDSVTMLTVTMVLTLASHLNEFTDFVKEGKYAEAGLANCLSPAFHDLGGKTWGILGYGNIGKKIGGVAEAFGCNVIYTRSADDGSPAFRNIDDLCRESDIISLNCPLNDGTYQIINEERIGLMKKNVILVNTARGAVCDEAALATAVKEGRIAGFGCDAYTAEPFGADHPYWEIMNMPNVCLTPHMGWASLEARNRAIREIAENIKAFLKGEKRNRVELA